jgi:hypothetical protein
MGIDTGVTIAGVARASWLIGERLDHPLPSRYLAAVRTQEIRDAETADGNEHKDHQDHKDR